METKTPIRLTLAMVMAMTVLGVTARSSITYQATYHQSEATLGTDTLGGVTYSTVSYQGLYNGGAPGAPSLPIDYLKFSVPYNATNFSVSTTVSSSFTLNPSIIYPCQPIRMMNDTTPLNITLPDSAIYYSNTYYPSQRAWVVDEGYLAGENHIVTVAVLPWQYKHFTRVGSVDQLKLYRIVNLTLSYDLRDSLAMYPIVREDTVLRNEGYRLTQEIVVNGGSVRSHAPVDIAMMDPDALIFPPGDGLNGGFPKDSLNLPIDSLNLPDPIDTRIKYPYLIVTTDNFLHSTRRLAALKRQEGLNVIIMTLNQIYNHAIASQGDVISGNDNEVIIDTTACGKIRRFLKYAYKSLDTEFVLLAGNDVPCKTELGINTDWYYYDLNSNAPSESYDLYPDLNIGRLLAKTADQIDYYTDKVMRYEINPGKGDFSYLSNAIVTKGLGLDVMNMFDKSVQYNLSTYCPNVHYYKEIKDQNTPIGKNLIDSINIIHTGFLGSMNHGSPFGIRVYGPDSNDNLSFVWAIDSIKNWYDLDNGNGLNLLHNKYYPMLYYTISCETMPFGYNTGTSFGESFTMGKDYGGPIYIGYTASIPSHPAIETFRCFLTNLALAKYRVGTAYSISKKGPDGLLFERATENALAHNLLGDPSIEMWTQTPQLFTGIVVTRSEKSITISNIGVDSTIISICSNNYDSKPINRTVSTSSITIDRVSPNSSIMLHKHNYIPYIVPLVLQNVALQNSQYVIASDMIAGHSVDSGRRSGDVTVKNGVEYEIEASGTVTLQDGFNVEKGATFAVYPACF